jgi:hypothetical protein
MSNLLDGMRDEDDEDEEDHVQDDVQVGQRGGPSFSLEAVDSLTTEEVRQNKDKKHTDRSPCIGCT